MTAQHSKRNYQTKKAICAYWDGRHPRISAIEDICWCCGEYTSLDRCHIHALVDGGSDTLDNVHLLCRPCHLRTEGMTPAAYWTYLEHHPYEPIARMTKRYEAIKAASAKMHDTGCG